jgi:hypothetical protein
MTKVRKRRKNMQTENRVYDIRCYAVPSFKTPDQYIKEKLKMLRGEMFIEPTKEELDHLFELTDEGDIDRAVHSIIARHWNELEGR